MPREERMFGDVVESSVKIGNQQWYTVPLSILVHTAVIGAIVIIPLLAADILPTPPSMMAHVARTSDGSPVSIIRNVIGYCSRTMCKRPTPLHSGMS